MPMPLSSGDALSVVSGDRLPEEISSMLCRRSCDDDDDLLSSSTVSCGEPGSNVLSSCNDCESICDSAANIHLQTGIINPSGEHPFLNVYIFAIEMNVRLVLDDEN